MQAHLTIGYSMKSIKLRLLLSVIVLLAGLYYSLPNIPSIGNSFLQSMLPSQRINLGLDLKGGMNLTLGVDVEKAIENTLSITGQGIRDRIIEEGLSILRPRMTNGELEIIVPKKENAQKTKEVIQKWYPNLQLTAENDYNAGSSSGVSLKYVLSDTARKEAESLTLDQVVRTIRNRIDQFGVAEPDIRKQSNNQVQVQLPGLTDTTRAIQIVGQTAHLEFRLVRDDVNPNSFVLPAGTARFPMTGKNGGQASIVLDNEVLLTGADIADARPSFDQYGSSYVSLKFSPQGAIAFEKITGENIKKRLAIVLDGEVYSAPVIQDRIAGGEASINGDFTTEEANDLAVVLRAGSLPAPVNILEERTVGPSLGQESIDSGVIASLVGAVLVLVMMPLFYGFSGLVADVLLCGTLALMFAGLSMFGATLTLPGIAGVVLTIGMAVDANVLIFERIREELKLGMSTQEAIYAGFSRASISIIDSNLTTIIAAVILYQFGTGPIRGFAVTLSLGIIASMFTSVFVCRAVFEWWNSKNPDKTLSV